MQDRVTTIVGEESILLSVDCHQIVTIWASSSMRDNGPSETGTYSPSDQPRCRVKFRLACVHESTNVVINSIAMEKRMDRSTFLGQDSLERQGVRMTEKVPTKQMSMLSRLPTQTYPANVLSSVLQRRRQRQLQEQEQQQQQQQQQQHGHALTLACSTAAENDSPPLTLPVSRPDRLRRRNPAEGG